MISNEDKKTWCELGEKAEQRFAGSAFKSNVVVFPNPSKVTNPFAHDFYIMQPADLKTIRTQFRTADRYGISPDTAITLNVKDIERYTKLYPHIVLIFDIDYPNFKSVRYTTLREIKRAIKLGKAKLHEYQSRIDDVRGNAKSSYVLDALWFSELQRP